MMSDYCNNLDSVHKKRYLSKIEAIQNQDPYTINLTDCSSAVEDFPQILYPNITNYLVNTKSAYTNEQMCAYKGMDAYNQAICGWVKKICAKQFGDNILVLGKVMHSQRLNEKLLTPWIIAKKDGNIMSAHCDCVAGLGEVCTHVCAVLFNLDEIIRNSEVATRTGRKAYWMPPSAKPADPKPIVDLDLRTPKRRYLDEEEDLLLRKETRKAKSSIKEVTPEEKFEFLQKIQASTSRGSVLHLVTPPFAGEIKSEREQKKKLHVMTFYQQMYEKNSLEQLQQLSTSVDLTLSIEDCKLIEKETKEQSKCRAWFGYRAGRITASKFKQCCRTKIEKPSLSLIKSICYPMKYKYKVKALEYGCRHEKQAIKDFVKKMSKEHPNFDVERMGFFINPKYPYFGASPDGNAECDCCGVGLVEVKCPYCARISGVEEKMQLKNFFLQAKGGQIIVDQNHAYYYQIQMQLAVTQQKYAYLVVWSPKDLVFTKVEFDEKFWIRESAKAKDFFFKVILPEALGKAFTRNTQLESTEIEEVEAEEVENWDVPIMEWDDILTEEWHTLDFYEEEVTTFE